MEDFQKVRLEKDLAELKKLIDTHFAQVNSKLESASDPAAGLRPWSMDPWFELYFSVKKMKKNLRSWNHKLIKEKMFVQSKSKNALVSNRKNWSGKRFVINLIYWCWWHVLVTNMTMCHQHWDSLWRLKHTESTYSPFLGRKTQGGRRSHQKKSRRRSQKEGGYGCYVYELFWLHGQETGAFLSKLDGPTGLKVNGLGEWTVPKFKKPKPKKTVGRSPFTFTGPSTLSNVHFGNVPFWPHSNSLTNFISGRSQKQKRRSW